MVILKNSPDLKPPANDNAGDARKCSICKKPQLEKFKPFCSKRCADIDLNRWLTGSYAIPVVESDQSSEAEEG